MIGHGSRAELVRAGQALLRFLNERRLRQRAEELTGYDPSPARLIRFAA